jgi:hypothetical protein
MGARDPDLPRLARGIYESVAGLTSPLVRA